MTQLKTAIDRLRQASSTTGSIESGEYAAAVADLIKITLKSYSEIKGAPYADLIARGLTAEDIAARYAEFQILLSERGRLLEARKTLAAQLAMFEGKQAETGRSPFDDLVGQTKPLGQTLTENDIDKDKVFATIRMNVASLGPDGLFQVAQGASIVDPEQDIWDLATVPNLNPDFIDALKRCRDSVPNLRRRIDESMAVTQVDWNRCAVNGIRPTDCPQSELARRSIADVHGAQAESMACNKYPDGSYIPAYGTARSNTQLPINSSPSDTFANNSSASPADSSNTPQPKGSFVLVGQPMQVSGATIKYWIYAANPAWLRGESRKAGEDGPFKGAAYPNEAVTLAPGQYAVMWWQYSVRAFTVGDGQTTRLELGTLVVPDVGYVYDDGTPVKSFRLDDATFGDVRDGNLTVDARFDTEYHLFAGTYRILIKRVWKTDLPGDFRTS